MQIVESNGGLNAEWIQLMSDLCVQQSDMNVFSWLYHFRSWSVCLKGLKRNKKLIQTIYFCTKSLPSSIFGDRHSYSQPWGGHSLTDWFHVNDWVDTVGASHNATLWIRTEAAVVQALVAVISATLLQRDSGGHTWDSNMNHQLADKGSNKNTHQNSHHITVKKHKLFAICLWQHLLCFFAPEVSNERS